MSESSELNPTCHFTIGIEGAVDTEKLPKLIDAIGRLGTPGLVVNISTNKPIERPAEAAPAAGQPSSGTETSANPEASGGSEDRSDLLRDSEGRPLNPAYYDLGRRRSDGVMVPLVTPRILRQVARETADNGGRQRTRESQTPTRIWHLVGIEHDQAPDQLGAYVATAAMVSLNPPERHQHGTLSGFYAERFGELVFAHGYYLFDIPGFGPESHGLLRQTCDRLLSFPGSTTDSAR